MDGRFVAIAEEGRLVQRAVWGFKVWAKMDAE